ncbi:ABC transporter permease [Halorubrum ezzemoulense DSM 17463]|uniref:ABC transporter permease n=1 Tax=Halorubrum ezzemoulense DSM 17463 TaxID=1121945 RepID=A0A1X4H9D9_HALEZ|nr:carbohydrate ABC transporter permease [Halorubrum ezzemoulense]OSP08333.1 ABC transporter permease [Halorubrum ezzemoulense DSM 17463]
MSNDARTDGGTVTEAGPGASAGLLSGLDAYRVLLYLGLLGMLSFFLIPIESGLVTSFKTASGVSGSLPFAPPTGGTFTFEKWRAAFDALGRGLINSALYAIPATVISALLGSFTAYGLTQSNWKQKYKAPVLALLVAGVFIPYQAVLVPLSQFWSMIPLQEWLGFLWALGINNDYASVIELIITHVAYGLPICTVLFRSYYKNMSDEMIEAARLDGASIRRIYRRIVLPLSGPMFAVVLIYQFTQIWNDLLFTLVLVQTESSAAAPIVLILAGLGTSLEGQDFALRMAGAFIAALPTLAVYIAFGEEFAEGVAT